MPIQVFVNDQDVIPIKVWAYKQKEAVFLVDTEEEVPKSVPKEDRQFIQMDFRRPSYADSMMILDGIDISNMIPGSRSMVIHDRILRSLLVDWNVKEGDKKAEINDTNLNKLNTDIIRGILLRLSDIIGL